MKTLLGRPNVRPCDAQIGLTQTFMRSVWDSHRTRAENVTESLIYGSERGAEQQTLSYNEGCSRWPFRPLPAGKEPCAAMLVLVSACRSLLRFRVRKTA